MTGKPLPVMTHPPGAVVVELDGAWYRFVPTIGVQRWVEPRFVGCDRPLLAPSRPFWRTLPAKAVVSRRVRALIEASTA